MEEEKDEASPLPCGSPNDDSIQPISDCSNSIGTNEEKNSDDDDDNEDDGQDNQHESNDKFGKLPLILGGLYFKITTCSDDGMKVSAKCIKCSSTAKQIRGSLSVTSNFVKHLKRKHQDDYKEFQDRQKKIIIDHKKKKQTVISLTTNPAPSKPEQKPISQFFRGPPTQAQVDELVKDYVVKSMRPLKSVEEEQFIKLVTGLRKEIEMELYDYKVDLKCLFSRDYTEEGDYKDSPGTENASFYRRPSQMKDGELRIEKTECEMNDSLILERRFGFNKKLNRGHGKPANKFIPKGKDEWENRNRDMISQYLRTPPNCMCNLTCLTNLMRPNNRYPKVIKASRFQLNDGGNTIYLKFGFKSTLLTSAENWSYHLECVLSTDPEGKEDINKTLVSLYEASLKLKSESESIQIAFTAETDGLWENDQRSDDYVFTKDDIVEVKGVSKSTLKGPTSWRGTKHFVFEEEWLRTVWSNCKIRDLPSVLCGVLDGGTLTEVWECNVNEIPRRVQECSRKTGTEWRRAFPESIELNSSALPPSDVQLQTWTEDDCFELLHKDLSFILSSFVSHTSTENDQYFVQYDGCGFKKISENEYLQFEILGRTRLLTFTDYHQKNTIRYMNTKRLEDVIQNIWSSFSIENVDHVSREVKDKVKNVKLRFGVERPGQVSIEVEFIDRSYAYDFQTKWNELRNSGERKKKEIGLPYEMFVQEIVTDRQRQFLKT